jgi:hypothetical protein
MDTLIIDEISMLSRKFLVQIQNIFESVRCSFYERIKKGGISEVYNC